MVELVEQKPLRGVEIVAQRVVTRIAKGLSLSISDTSMSAVAVSKLKSERYGPNVGEFELKKLDLPEDVKGALVSHAT